MAHVKYIEDRHQARAAGEDPELVEFVPPVSNEVGLGNAEDTVPLDGEAATHDCDDDEAMHEATDDEDPAI